MKKSAVTITLESLRHDEFMKVANEVSNQLRAGNRVTLELTDRMCEQSVRSLLVGRYLPNAIVTKLVIKKQPTA